MSLLIFTLMTRNLSLQIRNFLYKYNFNNAKYFNRDILRKIRIYIICNNIV